MSIHSNQEKMFSYLSWLKQQGQKWPRISSVIRAKSVPKIAIYHEDSLTPQTTVMKAKLISAMKLDTTISVWIDQAEQAQCSPAELTNIVFGRKLASMLTTRIVEIPSIQNWQGKQLLCLPSLSEMQENPKLKLPVWKLLSKLEIN